MFIMYIYIYLFLAPACAPVKQPQHEVRVVFKDHEQDNLGKNLSVCHIIGNKNVCVDVDEEIHGRFAKVKHKKV